MPLSEWEQYRHDQAKAWLEHVAQIRARMRDADEAVGELRQLAEGVFGIDYSIPHAQTSPDADRLPDAVSRIMDAVAAWCVEIGDYVDEATEAKIAVTALPNPKHRLILQRLYFDGWDMANLHDDQGLRYSKAHLARMHQQALIAVYEHMPTPYREPRPPAL